MKAQQQYKQQQQQNHHHRRLLIFNLHFFFALRIPALAKQSGERFGERIQLYFDRRRNVLCFRQSSARIYRSKLEILKCA